MTLKAYTCSWCGSSFTREKKNETRQLKRNLGYKPYCGKACFDKALDQKIVFFCETCGASGLRSPGKLSTHNFCSSSCSATFHNRNKAFGCRRSKLEIYIEECIQSELPDIWTVFNDRQALGLELDVYFPALRLALEFNGPLHYEPIYGDDTFHRIVDKDQQKLLQCAEQGIELIIIDVSSLSRFTPKAGQKYWNLLKPIILKVVNRK